MKRFFSFSVLILILLISTGCCNNENKLEPMQPGVRIEQVGEVYGSEIYHKNADEILKLYNIYIGGTVCKNQYLATSCEPSAENKGPVISVEAYRTSTYGDEYNPIIIIKTKDIIFAEILETTINYQPFLYLNDIDGDGEDEIIINSPYSQTFLSPNNLLILKIIDNKLQQLVKMPAIQWIPNESFPHKSYDFGFSTKLLDNYKAIIEFSALQYKEIINLPKDETYWEDYNEKNGKLISDGTNKILFEQFINIYPEDIDNNGIHEIIVLQNMRLPTTRSVGAIRIVLKFNTEKQQMNIIKVDFQEF